MISLMSDDRLQNVIGQLSDEAMRKADECLKAALGIG
jgi:mRNA-degrading endonuclease toxin of MazEF toxin-antitoxin module